MKLKELSERTGASTATLKYWMREGVLPPGTLRNQTTATYEEAHVERVELVRTLRERFDLPMARIRRLTRLIDAPDEPLLHVMEECQLIAMGSAGGGAEAGPTGESGPEATRSVAGQAELVERLISATGWPRLSSVARQVLIEALRDAEAFGYPFSLDDLTEYARALGGFAANDIAVIRPEGSRDAVARNLLLGASSQARVLLAMNQLAHTSAAVAATEEMRQA